MPFAGVALFLQHRPSLYRPLGDVQEPPARRGDTGISQHGRSPLGGPRDPELGRSAKRDPASGTQPDREDG